MTWPGLAQTMDLSAKDHEGYAAMELGKDGKSGKSGRIDEIKKLLLEHTVESCDSENTSCRSM